VHRKRETFFKETIIVILLFDDSSFSSVSITVKEEDKPKEEHPSTGKTIKNDFNGEKDWIRGVV
jgi:hypothetical protein